jgi:hypothetical protein
MPIEDNWRPAVGGAVGAGDLIRFPGDGAEHQITGNLDANAAHGALDLNMSCAYRRPSLRALSPS